MKAKKPAAQRSQRPSHRVMIISALFAGAVLTACSSLPAERSSNSSTSATPTRTATATPITPSLSHSTGTRELTFEPFSAEGASSPALRVSKTVSGHCIAAGVAGNSSYRCFAGNEIYDPCFARRGVSKGPLLCTSNPAGSGVVRFDVGTLLRTPREGSQESPWAIQISNGQVCVLVDAAWGGLGPFGCQPAAAGTLADCHMPEKASPWWTTACQAQTTDSSPFSRYRVTAVWS
jgi:hypothetical protein